MKKILSILLVALLLLGFASCAKNKQPSTTTAADSTKAEQSQSTTAEQKDTTAAKKADISFLYSGYWYKVAGNKVEVFQFEKDGSVTVSTFRRKNIGNDDNTPDAQTAGSFLDNGDGTLRVYPDKEESDVFSMYQATDSGKLICQNDDPEGESTIELDHFDSLSKEHAAAVLFGDN